MFFFHAQRGRRTLKGVPIPNYFRPVEDVERVLSCISPPKSIIHVSPSLYIIGPTSFHSSDIQAKALSILVRRSDCTSTRHARINIKLKNPPFTALVVVAVVVVVVVVAVVVVV